MRERRSLLNFAVLIVVAVGTTVFVLYRAQQAIAEIEALQSGTIYVSERGLGES